MQLECVALTLLWCFSACSPCYLLSDGSDTHRRINHSGQSLQVSLLANVSKHGLILSSEVCLMFSVHLSLWTYCRVCHCPYGDILYLLLPLVMFASEQ